LVLCSKIHTAIWPKQCTVNGEQTHKIVPSPWYFVTPPEDRARAIGNMHKKFGKDRACGSGDILTADTQTHTQTCSLQYFATAPAGDVIKYCQNTKGLSQKQNYNYSRNQISINSINTKTMQKLSKDLSLAEYMTNKRMPDTISRSEALRIHWPVLLKTIFDVKFICTPNAAKMFRYETLLNAR